LLIRFYSGVVSDDSFEASRREVRGEDLRGALATFREDDVTIFF
jgi:hypothetical protein